MNLRCASPGCPKEALSCDHGWVACEEHERRCPPYVAMPADLAVYVAEMRFRQVQERWHEQERTIYDQDA